MEIRVKISCGSQFIRHDHQQDIEMYISSNLSVSRQFLDGRRIVSQIYLSSYEKERSLRTVVIYLRYPLGNKGSRHNELIIDCNISFLWNHNLYYSSNLLIIIICVIDVGTGGEESQICFHT